jgi:hypothetical protein
MDAEVLSALGRLQRAGELTTTEVEPVSRLWQRLPSPGIRLTSSCQAHGLAAPICV